MRKALGAAEASGDKVARGQHSVLEKENQSLNQQHYSRRRDGERTTKRGRDEPSEALGAFETPVVFSRRKKRLVDAASGTDRASVDTPLDSWLSLSAAKPTPLALSSGATVSRVDLGGSASSLPTVARRLTPSIADKNPFAMVAKDLPSPSTYPPGFSNIGNSCYLASVTQCLLGASAFVGEIERLVAAGSGGIVTRALFDVIEEVRRRRGHILLLDGLKSALASSKCGSLFVGCRQSDAHEAFMKVLESVGDEQGERYNCPFSHSVEVEDKCESCKHMVRIEERGHLNVTLNVAASATTWGGSVLKALERTTERITKDCERCHGKDHTRTSLVTRMPQVLVVQLARFEFSAGVMKKVDDEFAVEKTVNISSDGSKRFELRSVVHHHGKYGHFGHYEAYVLRQRATPAAGPVWFRTSDSTVRPAAEADVLRPSRTSYLLFYDLV